MNALRLRCFRTGYVAAAAFLTIGASCMLQGPDLMRAVMTVGTDVQLPLEQIATGNREPAQVTDVSAPPHTPSSQSGPEQSSAHSLREYSHRTDANTRAPRLTPGYRWTITDYKYWT